MNLAAGLILLFLNLFLLGILYLRFYFAGEFTKQFSTRIPLIRLAFYSLIPGIILLSIALAIYNWIYDEFTVKNALCIFSELMKHTKKYNEHTEYFLDNEIDAYIWFTVITCFCSAILGWLSYYLIRKLKWDIKYKLFRFRNPWHYVFSGDIMESEKFMLASSALNKTSMRNLLKPEMRDKLLFIPYVHVLVNNANETNLYAGYVMDYELDSKDNQALDRIYLLDTRKMNGTKEIFDNDKIVKGDIFIIEYKHVLNMNLTFIPRLVTKQPRRREIVSKKKRKIILGTVIAIQIFIFFQLFFNLIKIDIISRFTNELNLFQKILFYLLMETIVSRMIHFLFRAKRDLNGKSDLPVFIIILIMNILSMIYSFWLKSD